ncbi:MAG: hypothetical protein HY355_01295 [Armatimonadetes bacterium]|nr:hypothetical protein [Armatimonadota bacterium]
MVTVQGAGALDEAVRKDLAASRLGYLRIARFDEPTAKEVAAELTQILKSNPMGILIDLRGNGGGLLDVSEEVANRFIPPDRPIVHVVDRQGKRATVRADRGSKIRLPLVVLVNEFSASASEIVAGALKDSAEATVVGMPTFGKGVIQTIYPLQGGGGAAITTAKYLTPSGRDIHGKGISPDVQVGDRLEGKNEAEVTRIQMEQLRRAIELLKQRVGQRR